MKILLVNDYASDTGGAELHMRSLRSQLHASRTRCAVVQQHGTAPTGRRAAGLRVLRHSVEIQDAAADGQSMGEQPVEST